MPFPEPDEFGNHEEPEPEVPEVFREIIKKGGVFPGWAEAFPEEDIHMYLNGKVIEIIGDILMDVKADIDCHRYRFIQKMKLPSGQDAYMVRENEFFELLSKTAARVWMAASQPDNDDGLPF